MTTAEYLRRNSVPATEANVTLCIVGQLLLYLAVGAAFCGIAEAGYFDDTFLRFSLPVQLLGLVAPLAPPAFVYAICWLPFPSLAVVARDSLSINAVLYLPFYLFLETVLLPHRVLYFEPRRVIAFPVGPVLVLLLMLVLLIMLMMIMMLLLRKEQATHPQEQGQPEDGPAMHDGYTVAWAEGEHSQYRVLSRKAKSRQSRRPTLRADGRLTSR